jgi:hypothetical protein
VTSIGSQAFISSTGLMAINVGAGNTDYSSVDGVLFSKDGKTLLGYPGGRTGGYTVPVGVTSIGNYAFRGHTGLTSIIISDPVASIGQGAFYGCTKLTSITIPDSVTSISSSAFDGCSALKAAALPEDMTYFGTSAFPSATKIIRYSGAVSVTAYEVTTDGDVMIRIVVNDGMVVATVSTTTAGASVAPGTDGDTHEVTFGANSTVDITVTEKTPTTGFEITFVIIGEGTVEYGPDTTSLVTLLGKKVQINGTEVYIRATPGAHYVSCTVNGNADYNTMTEGGIVTVVFVPDTYDVTLDSNSDAEVSDADGVIPGTGRSDAAAHGVDYTFTVDGEGYPLKVTVMIGTTATKELAPNNGVYTVYGSMITDDIAISAVKVNEISVPEGYVLSWIPDSAANTMKITGVVSGTGALIIPKTVQVGGVIYTVTSIGNYAFQNRTGLTAVTIPNTVTSIGDSAFRGCTGLTSITIPDSVESIENSAFYNCTGLTSITMPIDATIGSSAFYNCTKISEVTLTGGTTGVGVDYDSGTATYTPWYVNRNNTAGIEVTIADSVTSIGRDTFYNCTGLTTITIPDSVTSIIGRAFSGCTGLTEITMPIDATIGSSAFYNCTKISKVTLTGGTTGVGVNYDGLTAIDTPWYVSRGNTGIEVTIADSVTSIGNYTFYNCTGLTTITIPDSVTSIGDGAFWGCTGLTTITIPDSVTSIGDGAFSGCTGLTSINTGSGSLNYYSEGGVLFSKNKKTLIAYPAGKTGVYYPVPGGVTSIGNYAFYGCSGLESITIPDSVTSIGNYAFYGCSGLESITIPDSVTSIGNYAFYGCSGLESITMPIDATIGNNAFQGCTGILSITLTGGTTGAGVNYDGTPTYTPWYVSRGNTGIEVTIADGVTSIGNNAFRGCTGLTSITIPDSVESIGDYAFYNCTGLTTITMPIDATIGTNAFQGCTGILSITLTGGTTGAGVNYNNTTATYTPWYVSRGNTGIEVTIADGVTSIGKNAFRGCTGLTSITIPDSVESIGDYAFYNCTGLTTITIPSSVTSIGLQVFEGCNALGAIAIPGSFTMSGYSGKVIVYTGDALSATASVSGNNVTLTVVLADGRIISGVTAGTASGGDNIDVEENGNVLKFTVSGNIAYVNITDRDRYEISADIVGSEYGKVQYKTDRDNEFKDLTDAVFVGGTVSIKVVPKDNNYVIESLYVNSTKKDSAEFTVSGASVISVTFSAQKHIVYGAPGSSDVVIKDSGGDPLTGSGTENATYGSSYEFTVESKGPVYVTVSIGGGDAVKFEPVNDNTYVIDGDMITGHVIITAVNCLQAGDIIVEVRYAGSDEVTVFGYIDGNGNMDIPETFTIGSATYTVTAIGELAFNGCTGLTSVTIPDSVTSIGDNAFNGCTGLTSVTIPDSVTSIGDNAFNGCTELTTLTMPIDVVITNGVFSGCTKISNVTLTKGAAGVGVNYDSTTATYTPWYISKNNTAGIEVTIADGVTSIGNSAFNGCTGLTSITIMDSVTSIGGFAFAFCTGLTTITIPDFVIYIETQAFGGCTGLTSITIPDSVTSIGNLAFTACTGLTAINVGVDNPNYSSVSGVVFSKDGNTLLICPVGRTGEYPVPVGVTSIGDNAFYSCTKLTSVTIPDSVTSIGSEAFYYCTGLTSVTVPNSVTSIGNSAFQGCTGLTSVTIPSSVTSIGNSAFQGCTGLTSVTIPSSVTSLGNYAFQSCTLLRAIAVPGDVSVFGFAGKVVRYAGDALSATAFFENGNVMVTFTVGANMIISKITGGTDAFGGRDADPVNAGSAWKFTFPAGKDVIYAQVTEAGVIDVTVGGKDNGILYYSDGVDTGIDIPTDGKIPITTSITITAEPNTGYEVKWSVTPADADFDVDDNVIVVREACTVTAAFVLMKYEVKAFAEDGITIKENGSKVISDTDTGDAAHGMDYVFTVEIADGSVYVTAKIGNSVFEIFDSGDGYVIPGNLVTGGVEIYAVVAYSVTLDGYPDENGRIWYQRAGIDREPQEYQGTFVGPSGTEVAITVESDDGYVIRYPGGLLTDGTTLVFTSAGGDIHLSFVTERFVTVNIDGSNGSVWASIGTEDGYEVYDGDVIPLYDGGSVTITAAPSDHYVAVMTLDGNDKTSPLIISDAGTVLVTFSAKAYSVSVASGCEATVRDADGKDISGTEHRKASFGVDYVFTVTAGSKIMAVTVTVDGADVPVALEDGKYTIPGASIVDDVIINAVEFKLIVGTIELLVESNGPNTVSVVGYEGSINELTIPDDLTVNGVKYGITKIGDNAFENCAGLAEVTIPGSVISIGELAFSGCHDLVMVTIPRSVLTISETAFDGCECIASVIVSADNPNYFADTHALFDKNKTVLMRYFASAETEYEIPSSVTVIAYRAFEYRSELTSVTVPSSVSSVGDNAFDGCTGIDILVIPAIADVGDDIFAGRIVRYTGAVSAVAEVFDESGDDWIRIRFETDADEIHDVVSTTGDQPVKDGDSWIFAYEDGITVTVVTSFTVNVTVEGDLGRLTYSIGAGDPAALPEDGVIFSPDGDGVTIFAVPAANYKVTWTTVPGGAGEAGQDSITLNMSCILVVRFVPKTYDVTAEPGDFTVKEGSKDLASSAGEATYGIDYGFTVEGGKKLAEVTAKINGSDVPVTLDPISGAYVISGDLIIGNIVISAVGYEWEAGDVILNVEYNDDGTVTVAAYVSDSGTLDLSEEHTVNGVRYKVTRIADGALDNCNEITAIIIPKYFLGSIETAISSLTLTSIDVEDGHAAYSSVDGVLFNEGATTLIRYPSGNSRTAYRVPDSVTVIGDNAFEGSINLISVSMPNVTVIGDRAFYGCTGLTTVTFGATQSAMTFGMFMLAAVKTIEIGDNAFEGCTDLTTIDLTDVTSIGENAFKGCTNLKSLTIPDSVISVGPGAFDGCDGLVLIVEDDTIVTYHTGKIIRYVGMPVTASLADGIIMLTFTPDAGMVTGDVIIGTVKDGNDVTVSGSGNVRTFDVGTGSEFFMVAAAVETDDDDDNGNGSGGGDNTMIFVAVGAVAAVIVLAAVYFLFIRKP